MSKRKSKRSSFIDNVQVINDCLTGQAGLNLFVRYLRGIDLLPHIDRLFDSMRNNPKGLGHYRVVQADPLLFSTP